jgi:hypothetical protein
VQQEIVKLRRLVARRERGESIPQADHDDARKRLPAMEQQLRDRRAELYE